MDTKVEATEESEVLSDPVILADGCEVKLEVNYNEYHHSEITYETVNGEKELEDEEVELWPQEEGLYIKKERNACSDLRRWKVPKKDCDTDVEEEESGEECVVEIKTEAVEDKGEYLSCHHCGEKRKTKNELKQHIYSKHLSLFVDDHREANGEDKEKKCIFCNKDFESKSSLVLHMRTHTGVKPFQCNICGYSAAQKALVLIHLRKHTGEKPFSCSFCEFSCLTETLLRRHMVHHPGKEPFNCNMCEFSSSKKSQLRNHMLVHNRVISRQYKCDFCMYSTSKITFLRRHMLRHSEDKRFKCNMCESSFLLKTQLRAHMIEHTGLKPFKCNFCDYRALYKSRIQRHTRCHTGEKPFKCNLCDYSSSNMSTLRAHIVRHTDEKPFKCDLCEYASSRKQNLRCHIRLHTGEKPFKCKYCKYRTSMSAYLKIHTRIHTGERPFKCEICEFSSIHSKMHFFGLIVSGGNPFLFVKHWSAFDESHGRNESIENIQMRVLVSSNDYGTGCKYHSLRGQYNDIGDLYGIKFFVTFTNLFRHD
ncbi:hypothetical protein J437_LFUL014275 [Ladona fulva]|uniref:C2H2-type domain-containing protein n=1 Tax=Ladona fulva TaxID=123851 RepID=A0A8K0KKE7_LADFU|nr:hypothetical protein J437_LFUL014275 [Ladona fulva]